MFMQHRLLARWACKALLVAIPVLGTGTAAAQTVQTARTAQPAQPAQPAQAAQKTFRSTPSVVAEPAALALPAPGSAFALKGTSLQGAPVSTKDWRGKVTVVLYWRTDCQICREVMPELRANFSGWQDKPFELVTVSLDNKLSDAQEYERILSVMLGNSKRFRSLWMGHAEYADTLGGRPHKLPLALVLDKANKVVLAFEGRIPAEAWDTIAELL